MIRSTFNFLCIVLSFSFFARSATSEEPSRSLPTIQDNALVVVGETPNPCSSGGGVGIIQPMRLMADTIYQFRVDGIPRDQFSFRLYTGWVVKEHGPDPPFQYYDFLDPSNGDKDWDFVFQPEVKWNTWYGDFTLALVPHATADECTQDTSIEWDLQISAVPVHKHSDNQLQIGLLNILPCNGSSNYDGMRAFEFALSASVGAVAISVGLAHQDLFATFEDFWPYSELYKGLRPSEEEWNAVGRTQDLIQYDVNGDDGENQLSFWAEETDFYTVFAGDERPYLDDSHCRKREYQVVMMMEYTL